MAGVADAGVATVEVVSRRPGFWRLGRQWPAISVVTLTEDEVARLRADPNFVVHPADPVPEPAPAAEAAPAEARKRNTRAG